jgi:ubiquitin-activating enzyme E1
VGPDSEDIYDYDFYTNQDIITNALDNVKARTYVDNKCVENGLPLLESGTLGVKGNVQVVVPYKSESYSSSSDPPEKDIPVCTLKNFPSHINHTSQWARDLFEGLFTNVANNINQFNESPDFVTTLSAAELELTALNLRRYGISDVPTNTTDSIIVAVKHFNHYFYDMIIELLKQYPQDSNTSSGVPFWSGSKRCPQPIKFDPTVPLHVDFVNHFVHLYSKMYQMSVTEDINHELITSVLKGNSTHLTYPVTEKFAANEEEEKANQEAKNETSEDTLTSLHPDKFKLNVSNLIPEEFEKDDDSNHHIDFISTVANLRATNYHIPTADRHKIKGIVGRIIPAVATTTALVAGLVTLELCKFVAGHTSLDQFRNAFINLGTGFIAFSEPMPTAVQKFNGKEYTMWDQIDVRGSMTMSQFRNQIQKFYGCEVDAVNYGKKSLYRSYGNQYNPVDRDKELMSDIFTLMEIPLNQKSYLPLSIMLDTDEDFEEPDVRYWPTSAN